MRILMMTATPADPYSGAAGTEYRTIEALRELGHEVDAVWSDGLRRRLRHGNLHYLLELPLSYRAEMLRRLQQRPYDVVHVSQPHGWLAARTARLRGTRPVFVHRSHGFEPRVEAALAPWQTLQPRRSPLRRAASAAMRQALAFSNRMIARHATGHIVSGSLCAEFMAREYAVAPERIAVIAQAAPAAFLDTPAPPFDPRRLDRMLYVGQFAFVKAPMILARAAEQVFEARPQATLTWVCAAAHHAAVRELLGPQARERVRLLDWMPQERLMEIYDEHGLFLFPSFFEGFGKALVEAMARGLAVVASDEGGAHDIVEPGRNGLRVAVGDASGLARACLDLQRDPSAAAAMAAAGRRTAESHTWCGVATQTAAFYQRLLSMR